MFNCEIILTISSILKRKIFFNEIMTVDLEFFVSFCPLIPFAMPLCWFKVEFYEFLKSFASPFFE